MPKIDLSTVPVKTGSVYPAPYDAEMEGRSSLRIGDAGGMSQFGANLVTLNPGAKSSLRHWHQYEDELVMVTEGFLTLVEDSGSVVLTAGEFAAFPAGVKNGHHFVNHSETKAAFLVIGARERDEYVEYSDVDMKATAQNGNYVFTRKDGSEF
ncbi:transcriptional regulator [Amylibacter marinus]|uniref:Transcriptional regulator n=1 Tax=Amylibacter marinus TaxID=1475483 RepID=A0ABQ5VR65_9RHOB|nr:cupin domain-containing protein [Amylibacter marinus]GLQ33825.1 transcriptional regulator [Amylibacter marinus]